MKVQSPVSVCANIGKSTTNRNDQVPSTISSRRLAISLRAAPSSSWEGRRWPAAKNTQSPGFAPTASTRPARSASEMFFATGPPSSPSSPTVTYASPLAPRDFAHSCQASNARRGDVRRLEHPERRLGEEFGQLGQLQPEAKVGLVGAEAVHRLAVAHPRDL